MIDRRQAVVLVAVVAALVYANSLGNGFAYDDVPIVEDNATITSFDRLAQAVVSPYWPIPAGADLALWRPVTTGVLGLQYIAGGGSPLPFHITNVLLHAAASGLLVLLLAHLMSLPAALVAGLVFAVHPVHTEAVANVVGVAELISTVAVLGACMLHLQGGERSRWGRSLLIGLLFLIGFGAKEGAITLLGLIFLVDAARERLSFRDLPSYLARRWRVYFVMLVVAVGMLIGRLEVLQGVATPNRPLGADLLAEIPKIWTLGEIWTHYVRLWVFPLDLSADYSPNVIPISFGWHAINVTGVALVLLVLVGSIVAWRRGPLGVGSNSARAAAFGVMWFLIAVSPVSNTVFVSGVLLAERTLYLPSVGLAAAVGWLLVRMARDRPRAAPVILVLVLLAGSVRTWTRNPTWEDSRVVFLTLARDYPHSGRSQWLLGDTFLDRGQVSEGLFAYRAAMNLLDSNYVLVTHVTQKLMALGRYQAADKLLDIAIRDRPTSPLAYGMRAGVRAELGDAAGTERYARISLALYGRDPLRQHVLAWALAARGLWDEAAEARSRGDELGRVDFWQRWIYDGYVARREGDTAAMLAALDSATVKVNTEVGRVALDSILVHDFGVDPSAFRPDSELQP
ncbi:MAG: hypothetical protein WD995_12585 [Gemmatimonadota bacterium]